MHVKTSYVDQILQNVVKPMADHQKSIAFEGFDKQPALLFKRLSNTDSFSAVI